MTHALQLEGDLVEAVTALKNEPGRNIGLSGSVSVVRQLLATGSSEVGWCVCVRT
jgi:hypothetical protein